MANQNETPNHVLFLTDREHFAKLAGEVQALKDQMKQVAVILEQLSQKTATISERTTVWETQFAEIKPYLQAMKVHVDSFPHAMREARRSDQAAQKAVEELTTRLQAMESRIA